MSDSRVPTAPSTPLLASSGRVCQPNNRSSRVLRRASPCRIPLDRFPEPFSDESCRLKFMELRLADRIQEGSQESSDAVDAVRSGEVPLPP